MSALILYGARGSPPTATCLITLKALEIPFEFKVVDLFKREQKKESFKRLNVLGQVPVLDDNGTIIVESHAICIYLIEKYGKDDSLYPKDLVKRAIVNARLYFEVGALFGGFRNIIRPLFLKNSTVVPKEKTEIIFAAYEQMELYLNESKFIAGANLTIADFCCHTSLTALRPLLELDSKKFPKILEWYETMEQLPYYEESIAEGLGLLVGIIKSRSVDKTFVRTKPNIIYFTQS